MNIWPWKKTILERGTEDWNKYSEYDGRPIPNSGFKRDFVIYKITNVWTGSESLKKVYLN